MRRGTTPTHTFTSDLDLRSAEVMYMTYKQNGKTILERDLDGIEVEEDKLTIRLTQEETLAFNSMGDEVEIQCRVRFPDDNAAASDILRVPVKRILKDGVI